MFLLAVALALVGAAIGVAILAALGRWRFVSNLKAAQQRAQEWRMPTSKLVAGGLLALVVGTISRWPVLAIAAFFLPLFWDSVMHPDRESRRELAQAEAIIEWVEAIKDGMAAGANIESALVDSAAAVSPVLQVPVLRVARQLRANYPTSDVLRQLADDLHSAIADAALAPLIVVTQRQGGQVRSALDAVTVQARQRLSVLRHLEARRAGPYTTTRLVVGLSACLLLVVAVLPGGYMAPFGTLTGQLVMAVGLACYFTGARIMLSLAKDEPRPRFISPQGALLEEDDSPAAAPLGAVAVVTAQGWQIPGLGPLGPAGNSTGGTR